MLLKVPNTCLACMIARADYLEQFEVSSAARLIASVEVNETLSRTKRQDAIVFVESHAEDVGCIMRNREVHLMNGLCDGVVLGNARDRLVGHGCVELDVPLVGFQSDEGVCLSVKYGLDDGIMSLNLVFEDVALMEFVNALRLGQLQHVRLVQVLRPFLLQPHEVRGDCHGSR